MTVKVNNSTQKEAVIDSERAREEKKRLPTLSMASVNLPNLHHMAD